MLVVAACGTPGADRFIAVLNELELRPSWAVESELVDSPADTGCIPALNLYCPSATRFYVVADSPVQVLEDLRAAVESAGFDVEDVNHPECDSPLSGAACHITAVRGDISLEVNVYRPGHVVDGRGVLSDDATIVRAISRRSTGAPGPTAIAAW